MTESGAIAPVSGSVSQNSSFISRNSKTTALAFASSVVTGLAVVLASSMKAAAAQSGAPQEDAKTAPAEDRPAHNGAGEDPSLSMNQLMANLDQDVSRTSIDDAKERLASLFGEPVSDAMLTGEEGSEQQDLPPVESLGVSDPAQSIRGIVVNHDTARTASTTQLTSSASGGEGGSTETTDIQITNNYLSEVTNNYVTEVTEVTEISEVTNNYVTEITEITEVTNNYVTQEITVIECDCDDTDSNGGAGTTNDGDPDDITDQFLEGTSGDDRLETAAGYDTIHGYAGNDMIIAYAGGDQLFGGDGDDILNGGAGRDMLDGGEGNDTADYSTADAGVDVDLYMGEGYAGDSNGDYLVSIENLIGSAHDDFLYGNDEDNIISGGDGIDDLYGGYGKDFLNGGAGADWIDGGMGDEDVAEYVDSGEGVAVSLMDGEGYGGDAEGDILLGIEYLHGSLHDDWLEGDDKANRIMGRSGDDWLMGLGGNDTLVGGYGADFLDGGDGIDTADYLSSDQGVEVDLASGQAWNGEAEGDQLVSIENVAGTNQDDILTGNEDDNRLTGRDGDDILDGGAGDDILVGGLGADTLIGGDGDRDAADYGSATSGVGVDLSWGGFAGEASGDTFSSIEYVYGSAHDDAIFGDDNDNRLVGAGGNDEVNGGGGNDYIIGGSGNDFLTGGAGNDVFIFTGNFGSDEISDFEAGLGRTDRIWIEDAVITGWELIQTVLSDTGSGTEIALDGGTIFLAGISAGELVSDDFIFA